MSNTYNARIMHKRDTSANWTKSDPVLLNGEVVIVDTDNGARTKTGTGSKKYSQLPFDDEIVRNLISTKVSVDQGASNSGKVLCIGDNGNILPDNLSESQIKTALGYTPTKTWYVTVTKDGDSITGDKTPEEIYEAYQNGFAVYVMTSTFPNFEGVPFLIPCLAAIKIGSFYQIGFATSGTTSATISPTSMVIFYNGSTWQMWGHQLVSDTDIVDNLTSDDTDKPLSAAQGKVLNGKIPWAIPQLFGAMGNGSTDDTAAVQSALLNNRYVYIPAGTYKLSGTLNIRDGCRLELAPDAVLNFTQTSGNCITLGMSAQLNGNFATIVVPYAFSGNVIYISTASSTTLTGVPPFTKWTPQWKPARYVSDIFITKPDSRGFHYSVDGTCSGTAVYIEADGSATSTFIWGARLTGLRIAGAFSYGIHGVCLSNGWNHEMHLEAVIDACEIGICLEDCNNNYITATIQPRAALTTDNKSVPYAKHGIQLIRCRNTDLSETRVWDWNATNALWTEGGEYQHIAMIGNCSGTILGDFLYYETSYDIRSLIYTDTASNLEKMTILQEPFTRWFKPSEDGLTPYFYNGTANKELLQKDAFDALFQVSPVANFTNKLTTAATADGSVYNSVGYKSGVRLADADGTTEATLAGNTITGFIPCAEGDIIRLKGISFATNTYSAAKIYLYKSDHTKLAHVNHGLLTTNGSYYNVDSYEATDEGCSFRIVNGSAAYFRLSVDTATLTADPVVTVNEEISYSQAGFLADSVSVKANSVYGLEDYVKKQDILNNLTSNDITKPLSAAQGKVLKEMVDDIEIPTVPTTLPNPNKLTLTGAVNAAYDGSAAVAVEIPSVVNNLTSGATNRPLSAAQGKVLKELVDAQTPVVVTAITGGSQITADKTYGEIGLAIDEGKCVILCAKSTTTALGGTYYHLSSVADNMIRFRCAYMTNNENDEQEEADEIEEYTIVFSSDGTITQSRYDYQCPAQQDSVVIISGSVDGSSSTSISRWYTTIPDGQSIYDVMLKAHTANQEIVVNITDNSAWHTVLRLTKFEQSELYFEFSNYEIEESTSIPRLQTLRVYDDGSTSYSYMNPVDSGDIPSTLPNPNSLTFTGGVSKSYNGSSAVTVEIPQKPAAYVTASGTSGIWQYKKWSDGTAECWCTYSTTGVNASKNNYMGFYYADVIKIDLPFTFSSIPVVSVSGGGYSSMTIARTGPSTATQAGIWIVSAVSTATSVDVTAYIMVKGKYST